jgi:exonuclease III
MPVRSPRCGKLGCSEGSGSSEGFVVPSTKFLFWNVNRKPLADVVADLADVHRADVVMLAESHTEPAAVLQVLNAGRRGGFHFPTGMSKGVTIFTRFSRDFLQPRFESERVSIRSLALPQRPEVLVAAVHLPSKLHFSDQSQALECTELARRIADEEDRAGHRRTVLVGDFNMNPFEFGVVGAAGLNSVMSRRIAARLVRTVQGRE